MHIKGIEVVFALFTFDRSLIPHADHGFTRVEKFEDDLVL
jgi:hypothetical protein